MDGGSLFVGERQRARHAFVGTTQREPLHCSLLCDRQASCCMVQGRLRKPEDAVNAGDLPFSDSVIFSIANEFPMHA